MLNELENKIRKAIPELMELGVGTKFIDDNGFNAEIVYIDGGYYHYFTESHNKIFSISYPFLNTILGDIIDKPIQLNHVLEYLRNSNVVSTKEKFKNDLYRLYSKWNLKSNLLSDQSEELWRFILEIKKD